MRPQVNISTIQNNLLAARVRLSYLGSSNMRSRDPHHVIGSTTVRSSELNITEWSAGTGILVSLTQK